MKKALALLQRVENLILVATFAIMVLALFLQVVNRNLTQFSLPWLEEIAVYCMIYLVLLGTEVGLRDGTQLSISAVVDRFKGRAKTGIQIVAKVVVVGFSAVMLYSSINILGQQVRSGQTSAALGIPMWMPFFAFVLAFAIIVAVQSAALVVLVTAFLRNDADLGASLEVKVDEVAELMSEAIGEAARTREEEAR